MNEVALYRVYRAAVAGNEVEQSLDAPPFVDQHVRDNLPWKPHPFASAASGEMPAGLSLYICTHPMGW